MKSQSLLLDISSRCASIAGRASSIPLADRQALLERLNLLMEIVQLSGSKPTPNTSPQPAVPSIVGVGSDPAARKIYLTLWSAEHRLVKEMGPSEAVWHA